MSPLHLRSERLHLYRAAMLSRCGTPERTNLLNAPSKFRLFCKLSGIQKEAHKGLKGKRNKYKEEESTASNCWLASESPHFEKWRLVLIIQHEKKQGSMKV